MSREPVSFASYNTQSVEASGQSYYRARSFRRKGIDTPVKFNPQIVAEMFGGFVSHSPLWFGRNGGVVSVNTQARRLGCLIYVLSQVSDGRRIESMLLSMPSDDLGELNRNLAENGFRAGHLTARRSSVKHYLDAAIELHLLVRQGAVLNLTALGKFLLEAVRPKAKTPYPLTQATKVFFLRTLLGIDYFGITAVVRSLLDGPKPLITIQREHSGQLLCLLGDVSRSSPNTRMARVVQDRIISIRNWANPESYSEHLVSAKLNWLADLDILEAVPSTNAEICINRKHEDWLKDLAAATLPTESHLLAFTLDYALNCRADEAVAHDEDICLALDRAFELLADHTALKKIRCNDFLLFALCFHTALLTRSMRDGKKLLADSAVVCGENAYEFHFASRPTQSFIILKRTTES